ncbi:ImmA/IrrE family metallo-endopeptidase [Mammaliicoccus lentus]|uniref:ImmA/IrrE family metallo-endopeptidase n=1 Tax=Mammaliicoccus lentus TaxID=42858 RepID=UPI0011CB905F|nr:ImmA/IrrE family metallo-endopeptidase [Mammaliicoccus lentus]
MIMEDVINEITAYTIMDRFDLTIDYLSTIHNILIIYNDSINLYSNFKNRDVIFIKNDSSQIMWECFCHEFGHFYLHQTNQDRMNKLYNFKQEAEAEKFSLLLRMPERLIVSNELWTADKIVSYFNVSYKEAYQRIELLMNRSKTHRLVGVKSI